MGSNKDIGVINLFVSSETFHSKVKDFLDVAIVDESHRLVLRSGYYQNMGENQVQEIIRASKFSVFFIDENQIVHAKDVGTIEEIKASCQREKSDIYYDELPTQFRCNGSDGYLSWLDDLLQIKKTANPLFEADYNYDFDVVDSPSELFEWVKQKTKEETVQGCLQVIAGNGIQSQIIGLTILILMISPCSGTLKIPKHGL